MGGDKAKQRLMAVLGENDRHAQAVEREVFVEWWP
jgi:hypothetical protein